MGTVFNRGTKDNPNWYVGYRENGRWIYKASRQPTKALAKRWGLLRAASRESAPLGGRRTTSWYALSLMARTLPPGDSTGSPPTSNSDVWSPSTANGSCASWSTWSRVLYRLRPDAIEIVTIVPARIPLETDPEND